MKAQFHWLVPALVTLIATVAFADDKPTLKFSTGDPRALSLGDIREIRNGLVQIRIAKDGETTSTRRLITKGAYPKNRAYSVNYETGLLDDYMTARDAESYWQLGMRAWAVDFTGGPLNLWFTIETEGEVNRDDDFITGDGIFIVCSEKQGRLIWWCLPNSTTQRKNARVKRLTDAVGAIEPDHLATDPDGIPFCRAIQLVNGDCIETYNTIAERPAQLWADWPRVAFTRHSPNIVTVDRATPLLDIEAVETGLPKDQKPRKVRIKLMAKPAD